MSYKNRLLATALAGIFTSTAGAQEAPLEEVKVWGTEVTSNSLFLGEQEIAIKQADHLSDLLREIPGVDIGGTHSTNARINFRGLDDRDLITYIDGASQTNYLYHHMGNLLINADILKSAEIELGANSVVNGGLGGSIRFETKDAEDLLHADQQFGARIMGGYNSNAQTSYSFTGYGQLTDTFDALVYASRVDRDNFEDGDGVETIGSDGETDNILIKLGADLTDTQRIELSYEKVNDEGDYTQRPDMGVRLNSTITPDILLPTEYERETINLGYEIDLGENLDARITYYQNDMTLYRDETSTITRAGPGTEKRGLSDNSGLSVLAMSSFGDGDIGHTLTYGLDYFNQDLTYIANINSGAAPVIEHGDSVGVYVEDRIEFSNGFALTPGVRYNYYKQEVESTNADDSWNEVTFGLAGEWAITDGLTLLASYTELFKGPELAEVFVGDAANKIINADLEPETGENIEFGLRYTSELGAGRLNFGFNVFETTIDNYIVEQGVPGSATGAVADFNVGTAKIDGAEISLNYNLGNVDFLATFAKSDLDSSQLSVDDTTESLREIGDSLGLGLSYDLPERNVSFNYNARFVFEKDRLDGTTKDSYNIHNASVRWTEAFGVDGLDLTAGVDNLFDETYTSHASRVGVVVPTFLGIFEEVLLDDVEPGRNFKFTAAYTF